MPVFCLEVNGCKGELEFVKCGDLTLRSTQIQIFSYYGLIDWIGIIKYNDSRLLGGIKWGKYTQH